MKTSRRNNYKYTYTYIGTLGIYAVVTLNSIGGNELHTTGFYREKIEFSLLHDRRDWSSGVTSCYYVRTKNNKNVFPVVIIRYNLIYFL